MQEKSNSRRAPLSQLNNTLPSTSESGLGSQDGSMIQNFKSHLLKNEDKNIGSKQKKETSNVETSDVEGEYVKTLKKALKEAIDENEIVTISFEFLHL